VFIVFSLWLFSCNELGIFLYSLVLFWIGWEGDIFSVLSVSPTKTKLKSYLL